jgi:2,3-diaminopropionate biosynthesis protein SbnB
MDDLLVLRADDVAAAMGHDLMMTVEAVEAGYLALHRGEVVMPPSPFLRFVEGKPERVIGLPAFVKGDAPIAGIKWIASFPGNVARGIDRASAVIVVNDLDTGRPNVVLEGARISAARTAASAALAARALHPAADDVGVIGCGPIAWQTVRHLAVVGRLGDRLTTFDLDRERAQTFARRAVDLGLVRAAAVASGPEEALARPISVLATSAIVPHLDPQLAPEATVLHLSLRDLSPRCVRAATNIVDVVEHAVSANTSLHLASLEDGHHDFVHGTLAQILTGEVPPRPAGRPVVFSPFGLGVLDLAVARRVILQCTAMDLGVRVPNFFGSAWG